MINIILHGHYSDHVQAAVGKLAMLGCAVVKAPFIAQQLNSTQLDVELS